MRLVIMIFLTGTFFLAELVSGYLTRSNALIADSFHMLSDLLALIVALSAIVIAKRSSKTNTFGWIRAETIGALINSVFLMALCFTIFTSAIERMFRKERLERIDILLGVGAAGLVINLIGMVMFSEHHHHSHGSHGHSHERCRSESCSKLGDALGDHAENEGSQDLSIVPGSPSMMARYPERALNDIIIELQQQAGSDGANAMVGGDRTQEATGMDASPSNPVHPKRHWTSLLPWRKNKVKRQRNLNIKGVFLHLLADALGSVVVMISGLIIKFTPQDKEWVVYVDPVLSIVLVILIVTSTIPLFKESAHILLQNVPAHINARNLQEQLLRNIPEIDEVHDFHIWQLSNDKIIGSAHVKRSNLSNYMSVADNMKKFFHDNGIHSTTIQIEHDPISTMPTYDVIAGSNGNNTSDVNCLLSCPTTDGCVEQTCCGRFQRSTTISDNTINNNNTNGTANASPNARR